MKTCILTALDESFSALNTNSETGFCVVDEVLMAVMFLSALALVVIAEVIIKRNNGTRPAQAQARHRRRWQVKYLTSPLAILFLMLIVAVILMFRQCEKVVIPHLSVGDVYYRANPGIHFNPDIPPNPFVEIYKVEEVRGESVKVKECWIYINGNSNGPYEDWMDSSTLLYGSYKISP